MSRQNYYARRRQRQRRQVDHELDLKQVRLGIVMGGMHFAAGMPVRNLRTRLQNGFADAPLARRPALVHRGMGF
jgi:hypothetical protein